MLYSLFRKPLVLSPYLVVVYFTLEGFASVADYVPLYEIILPLFLILLFVFCFDLCLRFVIKDRIKRGVITFIIFIPLFFYYRIIDALSDNFAYLSRNRYLILFLVVFVVTCVWLVLRTKKKLSILNAFLNMLAACYFIYGIFLVVANIKPYDNALELRLRKLEVNPRHIVSAKSGTLPDIYYIILDAYTSQESLSKYFGYDNSDFIKQLKSRGFYVVEKSLAPSSQTLASLASSLNISNDPDLLGKPEGVLSCIIQDSVVVNNLSSQSYDIINFSFLKLKDTVRFYDAFPYRNQDFWNFHGLLFRSAIFYIAAMIQENNLWKVNLDILSRLKEVARTRSNSPRFIYAHLMIPHFPYFFDRNGNLISWVHRKPNYDKDAYLEQLIFCNKLVLEMVDNLLNVAARKPIIVIQGDHGSRLLENNSEEEWTILNAYYLPGGGDKLLYPTISPSNTFRVIFNYYFGMQYELLEDEINPG